MTKRLQQWTTRTAKLCVLPVTWLAGVAAALSPAGSVNAQVIATPEGAGTAVTESGDQFDISGGTQSGGNLFHAFEQFDLSESQTANFASDSGVFNIVGQISEAAPSYIDGTVQVSGSDANLYLINPSGVLFGPDAQLSLGGSFTATSADQVEFDGNVLNALEQTTDYSELTGDPSALHFTTDSAGSVVNQGELAVSAGESIALVGGTVVTTGSLEAPEGEVGLVAVGGNSTVKLATPGSLLSMEVAKTDLFVGSDGTFEPTDLPELLTGSPVTGADSLIVNADGTVTLGAAEVIDSGSGSVSDSGMAKPLPEDVSDSAVAVTDGSVVASGDISVASELGDGGTVVLLGESVTVAGARVDASGDRGGNIRVGGDLRGEGTLPTSAQAVVDADSTLLAEGLTGEGGEIVVWADDTAIVQGNVSVQGATAGGFVETSAQYLDISGIHVDVKGRSAGGTWLIDPVDYEVVSSGAGINQINASTIESTVDMGGHLLITTAGTGTDQGDIQLQTSINQTNAASTGSLLFEGRRFEDNGYQINLASSGQLTFGINAINPEANPDSISIGNAIAAIGNVNGDRLVRLGAGNYGFAGAVTLDTNVAIEGAGVANTILTTLVAGTNVFRVDPGIEAGISDVTITTAGLVANESGGGIVNRGSLTVDNSHFVDNRSSQNGGAIDSFLGGPLVVSNSEFIGNRSALTGRGGAIHLGGTSGLNRISNTLFENNHSVGSGGAINVDDGMLLVDSGSRFVNNAATQGGAVHAGRVGTAEFDGVTFLGNHSDTLGGALSIGGAVSAVVDNQTQFVSNTADGSGGAIAHNAADQTLTINNATFSENVSQEDGGAIFADNRTTTLVEESQLMANRAEGAESRGGGLAIVDGGHVRLTNTVVSNNVSSAKGGGLYVDADGSVTVSGRLTTDAEGVATIATARFVDNRAGRDGGGIAVLDESALVVSGVLFRGNFSGDDGGGVSVTETSQATIDNSNFESNRVTDNGGGLYSNNILPVLPTDNKVVLTNSRFIENEAGQSGGGFHQGENGDAVVRDSFFKGNQTMLGGGGVHVSTGMLILENGQLIANQAQLGGGLEVSSGGTATVSGSTFERNEAVAGGGLSNLGTTEIVNSTFSGNLAQTEGGAIRSDGLDAALNIRNTTITVNRAVTAGGGIADTNSQLIRLQNTIVAGNTSPVAADVSGRFIDEGNNLIGRDDGATGFTLSSLVGTVANPIDSGLSPLADNGGPTKTHRLLTNSRAIDAGSVLGSPAVDQRGLVRFSGSAVDIGAVELSPAELTEPTVDPTLPVDEIDDAASLLSSLLEPTLSTADFSELDSLLSVRQRYELDAAEVAIQQLENRFSQGFEDYWDLSSGPDLTFSEVQAVLRRAQAEYKVNSAVVYAIFAPEEPVEPDADTILQVDPTLANDDVLSLSVVMPEGDLVSYQLPVTRQEVVRQMRYFRSAVSDPDDSRSYQPLAQQLYQWLLAPLEEDLAAQNVQNLMYALDSGLRTAPVTAMRDDNGFALARYGLSVVPSMGLMQADFPVPVRRSTIAMGVSEFTSEAPLPAVPIELQVVDQFVPVSQTVLNESTTLDALKSVQALDQPGVLHLATHASFDRRSPEDSYIHLWNESLSMREFSQLDWEKSDLEMLILSACSTALGSRNSELGFAGLAAAAGVDATVGSLWEVSDVGTLALMSEFYAQLEKTDLRFEALRQAQLALLNGDTRIEGGNLITSHGEVDLPDDWNLPDTATLDHPFFWSAFTMVGNPW